MGPEEFVLTLEGPEFHALTQKQIHLRNCQYETLFHPEIPGKYRLGMTWTGSGNIATTETPGPQDIQLDLKLILISAIKPKQAKFETEF